MVDKRTPAEKVPNVRYSGENVQSRIYQLLEDATEAIEVFGEDALEEFAKECPRCSHGNIYEDCSQCDSDARLGVDSSVLDQIPNDDPDLGLDDPTWGFYPDTVGVLD